jgi:N-methylhydantoinase A/oxoprolinase/acetone carboxylase beta subunit
MRGSGMPVVIPSIELIEIGAGGGSLSRIDAMGLLKVGPESAGADPGPVCYGFGGTEPTVTDANLVLGFLDPKYFLGGRFELDLTATTDAFARLGAEAGMSAIETAWGVHQVVNENMAQAARMHLQERNVDPRKVTMVAFGGAGPAHAASIARLLGTERVIYPLGAGATSALGCLIAPLSFQFTRTSISILEEQDWNAINDMFADMRERGYASLSEAGIGKDQVEFMLEADLRVYGQLHELTVAVPDQALGAEAVGVLKAAFAKEYQQMYGRYNESLLIESVNWKVTAVGPRRNVVLKSAGVDSAGNALKGHRDVFLPEEKAFGSVPVYDRYLLPAGAEINGPAIVEERETTVNLPSGCVAVIDEFGSLVANLAGREKAAV